MLALRTMPPGLSSTMRRTLAALLVAQVALIITVALVTAFQFHLLTVIDEEAHFSYVQQIAEHGSLPVLGRTETSLQGLAVYQGVYPHPTTIDPKKDGLAGLSYEAFQPPLYYIAAVPAFYVTSNYIDKIYSIRLFDVLLLLGSVVLAGRLNRAVLADRWMIGWSMSLVFFALPGVVVRFVTISNLGLAVPLAILFATELWIAWSRHSGRRLMVAGMVLGLCVLTQLELVSLIPVFATVLVAEARRRSTLRSWRPLLVALVIPLVLVAPWFAFNEGHYHMLTAGSLAIKEQTPIVNPDHLRYSWSQLPDDTVTFLVDPTLPAEWNHALDPQPALNYLDQLLAILMVPAGLILVVGMGRRLWSMRAAILGLPYLFNVVEMWYIRYVQQWAIYARYTYPTLPIFLTLVALATDTFRARTLPVLVTASAMGSVILIWGFFIFGYDGPWRLT
jgi:hypothetical protein